MRDKCRCPMSKIDLKSMEIQLGERDTERTLKND